MSVKRSIFVFLLVLCSLATSGITHADVPSGPKTSWEAPSSSGSHLWLRDRLTSPEAYTPQERVWSERQFPPHQTKAGLATQVEYLSIADTCVLQGYPSGNFGTFGDMWAGFDDDPESDAQIVAWHGAL